MVVDDSEDGQKTTAESLETREWPSLSLAWPVADKTSLSSVLDKDEERRNKNAKLFYERELERRPNNVKAWVAYISQTGDVMERFNLYENATLINYGSYKLSMMYLREMMQFISNENENKNKNKNENENKNKYHLKINPNSIYLNKIEFIFERSVTRFSKMPQMWLLYLHFLFSKRHKITKTRKTFNRAIRSLPLTQHHLIWDSFVSEFILKGLNENCPLTTSTLLRRYVELQPGHSELLIAHLIRIGNHKEAISRLLKICYDDDFISLSGKTKLQQWMELCSLTSSHPEALDGLDVDSILRCGIRSFPSLVSPMWIALAGCYTRQGDIESARDIYEEAIESVANVKDFGTIFDSYISFLQNVLSKLMEELSETENKQMDSESQMVLKQARDLEVDLFLSRLEHLLDSRGELLSSVKLRQCPNNVYEWLTRTRLLCLPKTKKRQRTIQRQQDNKTTEFESTTIIDDIDISQVPDAEKVVKCLTEAILTVDDSNAVGKVFDLWMTFARFYELNGDTENTRDIFRRATLSSNYRNANHLAQIWRVRIEFEIKRGDFKTALELARDSISPKYISQENEKSENNIPENENVSILLRKSLFRSSHLWSLALDLEEQFGTDDTLKSTIDKMVNLKVVTVNQIFGFANYLQEKNCYEESFQLYEKAISVFKWPHVNDLWIVYLTQFVSRFGNTKNERARELFEEARSDVPAEFASRLYFLYSSFEEHYGLMTHCLEILHKATAVVPVEERRKFYELLIAKTAGHLGSIKTRPIFEEALQKVSEMDTEFISRQFVTLEISLLDYARARAIFDHVSQFCNPSKNQEFWANWREFEISYGNEETFKLMLQKRRSVKARFEESLLPELIISAPPRPSEP